MAAAVTLLITGDEKPCAPVPKEVEARGFEPSNLSPPMSATMQANKTTTKGQSIDRALVLYRCTHFYRQANRASKRREEEASSAAAAASPGSMPVPSSLATAAARRDWDDKSSKPSIHVVNREIARMSLTSSSYPPHPTLSGAISEQLGSPHAARLHRAATLPNSTEDTDEDRSFFGNIYASLRGEEISDEQRISSLPRRAVLMRRESHRDPFRNTETVQEEKERCRADISTQRRRRTQIEKANSFASLASIEARANQINVRNHQNKSSGRN
mmetsp:Transcript_22559/g.64905  ORF Transcript_22559/g.64905 Transcript_22559/m.64905 type:complete len:272 (+) Transcript_22559:232-1047(+)